MSSHKDIFIVGFNISKAEASTIARTNADIVRVAHGVYLKAGVDVEKIFNEYGLRLANYFFKNAALSHSTAWYKQPVAGRIFLGGDYAYRKPIGADDKNLCIVQSKTYPILTDTRLYDVLQIQDGFGKNEQFEIFCSTPELVLLEVILKQRKNVEKNLDDIEMEKITSFLLKKHRNKSSLLNYLEDIAATTNRQSDFERFARYLLLNKKWL